MRRAFALCSNFCARAIPRTLSATKAGPGILLATFALLFLALAASAATGTIRDVQHVVVFIQENRSFDEYFGAKQGVRGFADRSVLRFPNTNTVFYQPFGAGYVLPFYLNYQCLSDVAHDWTTGHAAWDGGKWDQWVPAKGTTALTYHTRTELGYYYALAEAYTICDAYFCSVLGPTNPNRLYSMTGMIDPNGTGGGPVIDNSEPGFSWTTYPERLQNAGVAWKVYQEADNFDDNALAWFVQYRSAAPGTPLYDRGMSTVSDLVTAFRHDVTNNSLPRVSWLIAPTALSEHPIYSPSSGELLTRQLISALALNPTVFNSTVFILTYDENGGFFDHIPSPVPPPGTAAEFVSGLPIGLGARVPTIIVSPWTRGGYVCSQVFDHTSLIRFLEQVTGVVEPNISAWRRMVCGDLTSAFDFAHPDTTVPALPGVVPVVCVGGINPTVPSPQYDPAQESGSAPGRRLPYQLATASYADCAAGRFYINITNTGSAAAHLAVYANAFRPDGPWQYDVPAGGSLSDYFSVVLFGGGHYDMTAFGPNGFVRRFAGNVNSLCNQLEAWCNTDGDAGTVTVHFRNSTSADATFTVTANAYLTGGPWDYSVPASNTVSTTFFVATNSNWYDLRTTTTADNTFIRRFAGHIEPPPPGQVTLWYSINAGIIHFTWQGSPTAKLQQAYTLSPATWADVAGTVGASSADVPVSATAAYFRLSD